MEYLTAKEAAARADKLLEHSKGLTPPEQVILQDLLQSVERNLKDRNLWVGEVARTPERVIDKLRELEYRIEYEARKKPQRPFTLPNPLGEEFVEWYRIYW